MTANVLVPATDIVGQPGTTIYTDAYAAGFTLQSAMNLGCRGDLEHQLSRAGRRQPAEHSHQSHLGPTEVLPVKPETGWRARLPLQGNEMREMEKSRKKITQLITTRTAGHDNFHGH